MHLTTNSIKNLFFIGFIFFSLNLFAPRLLANNVININSQGSVAIVNGIVIDNQLSKNTIMGNNKVLTLKRTLQPFTQIVIELSADIEIFHSDKSYIEITSDENIIPLVTSKIKNKNLILSSRANFSSSNTIRVNIYTPFVNRISIDGTAGVIMKEIDLEQLDLIINGVGDLIVSGKVKNLMAILNGSGDMNLGALRSKNSTIRINGSGDIKVNASLKLDAQIYGSGDISYLGNPQKIITHILGSGDIYGNE